MFSKLKLEYLEIIDSFRRRGSFGRNLLISSAGSSSAYLLGFLLSPVLARIYQPEAYGLYALFNAFVSNLSIVATLNYVNAFVLPKSDKEFIPLLQLTLISIGMVVVATSIVIFVAKPQILNLFNAQSLDSLIYMVPVIVLFTAINRCLVSWNIRVKEFKQGAKAKIWSTLGAKLITIVYGLISRGNPAGFIVGDLLSKPLTVFSLLSNPVRNSWPKVLDFSPRHIYRIAIEYKNYPLYNLPSTTLVALSSQLPIYFFSVYFSAAVAGHFSLAVSLISAPTQLLGIAIAQVFYQKATEVFQQEKAHLERLTGSYFRKLIYVAAVPYAIIAVFGDIIFNTAFGNDWQVSGNFASYLSLMAYMTFISTSISSIYRVLRLEKLQFQVVLLGSLVVVIGLVISLLFHDASYFVLAFSILSALLQLVLIAIAFHKIRLPVIRLIFNSLAVFAVLILSMILVRSLLGIPFF